MMPTFPAYSLRHIFILLSLGLILGVYLIATTVMVSKDGIFYIETAQKMQSELSAVLGERPSLYEFFILLSHRLFYAISGNSSVQGWLWAGQGVTLFCKVLAIIPLYLTGCMLATPKTSFRGCLILLALPEPAHLGCDVLREWPNLLFMSLSFLCLLYGARKKTPWAFLLVGLFGGISFLIRSESAQLIVFAAIILIAMIITTKINSVRFKAALGSLLLIACFSCAVLIYAHHSGRMDTRYLEKFKAKVQAPAIKPALTPSDGGIKNHRSGTAYTSILTLPYEIFKGLGELLMWFFLPFWAIGLYRRLRYDADAAERFLVIALISTSLGLILFRFLFVQPILSGRWYLPFVALTTLYIPIGIEEVVRRAGNKNRGIDNSANPWTLAIIIFGILICLPKLAKPLGYDKKDYAAAARWISENTPENALLYCFHDRRIPFYAHRNYVVYKENRGIDPMQKADYLITLSKKGQAEVMLPAAGLELKKRFSGSDGKREVQIFRYDPRITVPCDLTPQRQF